ERLAANDENNALTPMEWLWSRRKRGVIATTISGPHLGWIGAIDDEGISLCNLSSQSPVLSPQSMSFPLAERASQQIKFNDRQVFLEYVEPAQELILFGAGADAVPLAGLARSLGWRVTVIDLRSGPAVVERTFDADAVLRTRADRLGELSFPFDSAIVVMTHNWSHDLAVLHRLCGVPLRYLGILGPRKRTERMMSTLGRPIADHLRYPVGLDIGARNPEEIALAIVAEITAVRREAPGGPLRGRQGPIHSRGDAPDGPFDENTSCSIAAS
ncbi:MAG TPA: XdhC family protein, partial [Tepidisphaeraceae bacterium]|nr:XdhC family protein [Tepidisphaeraceae bacterium]